jgi:hypothetical protein
VPGWPHTVRTASRAGAAAQPPDVEPLVVVWDGVGVAEGGLDGGLTVGFAVGLLDVGAGAGWDDFCGLAAEECALGAADVAALAAALWPGDACGLALPAGLPLVLTPGVVEGEVPEVLVVAAVVAEWLKRFMKPTTPTALRRVARQVRVDTRRRPSSRRARSRSRCLMGA